MSFHLPFLLLACAAGDSVETGDPAPTCTAPEGTFAPDAFGGDSRVALQATGFFRVEKVCDRWWFVTPEGHPFWSAGVNHVTPWGDTNLVTGETAYADTVDALYGSHEAWADATRDRLRSWGFTTAGGWTSLDLLAPRMPITSVLGLGPYDWYTGDTGDLFDPAWEDQVEATVAGIAPWAEEPNVVGWFLDNEMAWGPDWHDTDTLVEKYLEKPASAPGKQAAVDLLLEEAGSVEALNTRLGTAFADRTALLDATGGWDAVGDDPALVEAFQARAADRYFGVATTAVRAVDPNHLVLGNREVSVMAPRAVYEVAATYVDVFSINNYVFLDGVAEGVLQLCDALDPSDGFAALHALVDLPVLITEFGFRADDAGLPNTYPPIYPNLETQAERADAFEEYARFHQSVPWIVGYHWFEWVDQPVDGRAGDGEDNNWGLVDEQDRVYAEVTDRMTVVNGGIWGELEVGG